VLAAHKEAKVALLGFLSGCQSQRPKSTKRKRRKVQLFKGAVFAIRLIGEHGWEKQRKSHVAHCNVFAFPCGPHNWVVLFSLHHLSSSLPLSAAASKFPRRPEGGHFRLQWQSIAWLSPRTITRTACHDTTSAGHSPAGLPFKLRAHSKGGSAWPRTDVGPPGPLD
jgi:hypothetical protein